jgi:endoglycosylceramidase
LEDPIVEFERSRLQPFMERCARAIRAVDDRGLIFVEPSIMVGIGVRSGLQPLRDARGARIEGIVYAPHYYDPIAEALPYDGRIQRARDGMSRIAACAQVLDAPVVVGEWGFLRDSVGGADVLARDLQRVMNESMFGQCYWDYHSQLRSSGFVAELVRPRPRRISGEPLSILFEPGSRQLTLRFAERGARGPTVIATPAGLYPRGIEVQSSDPAGQWSWVASPGLDFIEITSDSTQSVHTLTIRPR